MHAIQDVSPRSTLLRRLTAPLRRAAAFLVPAKPARTEPHASVLASARGQGLGILLTMRGADGVPYRCVEVRRLADAPVPPGSVADEPTRRSA